MNTLVNPLFIAGLIVIAIFAVGAFSLAAISNGTESKSKTAILDGVSYRVDTRQYGWSGFKININGEAGGIYISDEECINVDSYKEKVREAIEEYKTRHTREAAFKRWDGTL